MEASQSQAAKCGIAAADMEEAFAQLYQEFQQLQDLCARQAELLQKLTGKKSPNIDMPVCMPIQCTDAGDSNRKEDCISSSPGHAVRGEASEQAAPKSFRPTSADTNHHPDDSALLLQLNNYHLFCHKTEDRSILGLYNQDVLMNKTGRELDVGGSLQHYSTTKIASQTTKEKATFSPIPQNFPFLDLNDQAEFCSFSDIYNAPHSLPSDVVAIEDDKPTGDVFPHEVRGPAQNSWSPTCTSEDCLLGVSAKMSSESFSISSQTCDFCQAVFPAGAATKGEYLWHLTGHVE